jgi:hypothetical protein
MPGADLSRYSDAELQAMLAQTRGGAGDLSQIPTEKLQAMLPPQPAAQAGIAGVGQPAAPGVAPIAPAGGTEAFGRGALQGASLGFGDELAGAIAALGVPDARIQYPEGAGFGERYATARDFYRAKNSGAREAYPKTYVGGQIAGGLAAPGIGTVAKVGTLSNGARIAALAGAGATAGGLAGFGNAEGDLGDQLGEAARGAVVGGLVTPALDTAVRAAAVPLAATARGLQQGAGYALSRVAGGIQRDVGPAGGAAAFANAGLDGEAAGLIKPWDVFPGAAERQAARVSDFAQKSTDEITKAIDDAGARIAVAPLKQAILQGTDELRQFADANPAMLGKVDGLLKSLDKNADTSGTISARSLQTAKTVIDDFIATWDPFGKSSLAQGVNKALYGAVKDAQEQAVEAAGSTTGRAAYEAAKKASALAQKLEKFQASAARRQANQLSNVGGLHGVLGGIAGLASGDPIAGLATYVGTRVLTSPRTAAIGLDAASKLARVAPRYAASPLNPLIARSAAQAMVGSLERR